MDRSNAYAMGWGAGANIVMSVVRFFIWPEAPEAMEGWITLFIMGVVVHKTSDEKPV